MVPSDAHLPPLRRVDVYRTDLDSVEVLVCGVLVVTTPTRTALDVASTFPLEEAVIALDSAYRTAGVSPDELDAVFGASHRRGVQNARKALALADPRSGSVPESEARLLFARAGLPAPELQLEVYADGAFIARVDFGWVLERLAVEIDGFAYHSAGGAFQRDRDRQNALVSAGWKVLRFTVSDLRDRPEYVVAQILAALGY